ncbi:MAG: ParB/RepB/Spo0J family partition protein, partial [Firmicutes bacterium]|nr:ParB/RepB/Spo0J family partition protein [Bacillota bacterium]
MKDKIEQIEISDIDTFKNHPFRVKPDESFYELVESIKNNGLLNPIVVRKKGDRYELISGHRRKEVMELLGNEYINAIVKDLSDDEATIEMVDSNIYRDKILPSEKAFAYKMKFDAIKHQGKRSGPEVQKLNSTEVIGKSSGESEKNVRRYIRLTNLIPDILKLVDNTVLYDKKTHLTMGIKPAVELSYLNKDEQQLVYETIKYIDATPSHAQAIKIKELSKAKELNFNSLEEIMSQNKGIQNETISFNKNKIESALPIELMQRDKRYIEEYIIKAINY